MSTKKKRETSKIFYVSKLKITHADYAHMLWSFGNHGKCVEVCASSVYFKKNATMSSSWPMELIGIIVFVSVLLLGLGGLVLYACCNNVMWKPRHSV